MGHAICKFRYETKFAIPRRFCRQEHVPMSADFAHVSKISSREEISCRQENFGLGRKKSYWAGQVRQIKNPQSSNLRHSSYHKDSPVRRALTGRVEFSLRKELVMSA
jgi:hypothetical protein